MDFEKATKLLASKSAKAPGRQGVGNVVAGSSNLSVRRASSTRCLSSEGKLDSLRAATLIFVHASDRFSTI